MPTMSCQLSVCSPNPIQACLQQAMRRRQWQLARHWWWEGRCGGSFSGRPWVCGCTWGHGVFWPPAGNGALEDYDVGGLLTATVSGKVVEHFAERHLAVEGSGASQREKAVSWWLGRKGSHVVQQCRWDTRARLWQPQCAQLSHRCCLRLMHWWMDHMLHWRQQGSWKDDLRLQFSWPLYRWDERVCWHHWGYQSIEGGW